MLVFNLNYLPRSMMGDATSYFLLGFHLTLLQHFGTHVKIYCLERINKCAFLLFVCLFKFSNTLRVTGEPEVSQHVWLSIQPDTLPEHHGLLLSLPLSLCTKSFLTVVDRPKTSLESLVQGQQEEILMIFLSSLVCRG